MQKAQHYLQELCRAWRSESDSKENWKYYFQRLLQIRIFMFPMTIKVQISTHHVSSFGSITNIAANGLMFPILK